LRRRRAAEASYTQVSYDCSIEINTRTVAGESERPRPQFHEQQRCVYGSGYEAAQPFRIANLRSPEFMGMVRLSSDSSGVQSLLSAEPSVDRVLTVARVALSLQDAPSACQTYRSALEHAVAAEPPPFGTEAYQAVYREASANPRWLAVSLMSNAEREGDGAMRLWSLAACSDNEEERQLIKRHACDESRHALAYLALLDLTFPDAVAPLFRAELNKLSPGYAMGQELVADASSPYARTPTIDDYIQMNIAENRTTIHHIMQRTALALHCPPANFSRATRILDVLLRDELNHVAYTAILVDRRATDTDALHALFRRRLRDFNRITDDELGRTAFN
jgi:hypothetical protein